MYAPVDGSIVPPDPLVVSVNENPAPLPPEAVNVFVPRGVTDADVGLIDRAAVTVTVAVALLPSESVTVIVSDVFPALPAV
jgi:hypothetical protein